MSSTKNQVMAISKAAKDYYSLGTTVSSIILPTVIGITWVVIKRLFPTLPAEFTLLFLCFLGSYVPAFFLPEPHGYRNSGKLRLTLSECIFGFFNAFVLFATVLGANCWVSGGGAAHGS